MSACVETMFYVREKPWHGLGVQVMDAPTSHDALILRTAQRLYLCRRPYPRLQSQHPQQRPRHARDRD